MCSTATEMGVLDACSRKSRLRQGGHNLCDPARHAPPRSAVHPPSGLLTALASTTGAASTPARASPRSGAGCFSLASGAGRGRMPALARPARGRPDQCRGEEIQWVATHLRDCLRVPYR
jgi:hypothetical protein